MKEKLMTGGAAVAAAAASLCRIGPLLFVIPGLGSFGAATKVRLLSQDGLSLNHNSAKCCLLNFTLWFKGKSEVGDKMCSPPR